MASFYMFQRCQASPLALHARTAVLGTLAWKSCSSQEAVKFARETLKSAFGRRERQVQSVNHRSKIVKDMPRTFAYSLSLREDD